MLCSPSLAAHHLGDVLSYMQVLKNLGKVPNGMGLVVYKETISAFQPESCKMVVLRETKGEICAHALVGQQHKMSRTEVGPSVPALLHVLL